MKLHAKLLQKKNYRTAFKMLGSIVPTESLAIMEPFLNSVT